MKDVRMDTCPPSKPSPCCCMSVDGRSQQPSHTFSEALEFSCFMSGQKSSSAASHLQTGLRVDMEEADAQPIFTFS